MTSNQRTPLADQSKPFIKGASMPRRTGSWIVNFLVPETLLHAVAGPVATWLMLIWVGFNSCWMRGRTGRSVGEVLFNLRVCRIYESDFDSSFYLIAMTPTLATVRNLCRIFDFIPLFYGVIRPLRQGLGQTFSDEMTHTMVIKDHPAHSIVSMKDVLQAEGRA